MHTEQLNFICLSVTSDYQLNESMLVDYLTNICSSHTNFFIYIPEKEVTNTLAVLDLFCGRTTNCAVVSGNTTPRNRRTLYRIAEITTNVITYRAYILNTIRTNHLHFIE